MYSDLRCEDVKVWNNYNTPSKLNDHRRWLIRFRLGKLARTTFLGVANTLKTLHLSHNPLDGATIGAAISPLNMVRELYLDDIASLQLSPASFSQSQQQALRVLSIRNTLIGDSSLWAVLPALPALQTLLASRCSLTTIPDRAFRSNAVLRTVDLSYNSIGPTVGELQLFGLPTDLQSMNLNGNQLTSVSRCALDRFDAFNLFQLGLGDNPLDCANCSMYWLFKTLKDTNEFQLNSSTWSCDDGRMFGRLSEINFADCPPFMSSSAVDCADQNTSTNGQRLSIIVSIRLSKRAKVLSKAGFSTVPQFD